MDRPLHFATWTNRQVVSWMKGLDDALEPYLELFVSKHMNGKWLAGLYPQLLEKIGIKKVGLQIIIMEGLTSLSQQFRTMDTENLQTVILHVDCDATSVVTSVERRLKLESLQGNIENPMDEAYPGIFIDIKKSTTNVVSAVLKLMTSIEQAVFWLERTPFNTLPDLSAMKRLFLDKMVVVNKSAQMVVTSGSIQKFKDIKSYAGIIRNKAEEFVQSCKDSLYITPCTLDLVQIKKVDNVEFGINIRSTLANVHVVDSVVIDSPAAKTSHVDEGDEVIQVNEQTVIGWQHRSVIEEMRTSPRKVTLLLRKRPSHHSDMAGYPGPRRHKPPHNPLATVPRTGALARPKRRALLPDMARDGSPGPSSATSSPLPPTPAGGSGGPPGLTTASEESVGSPANGDKSYDYRSDQFSSTPAAPVVEPGLKTESIESSGESREADPANRPSRQASPGPTNDDDDFSDSDASQGAFRNSEGKRTPVIPRVQLLSAVEDEEDRMSVGSSTSTLKKETIYDAVRFRKPGILTKKSNRRISCKDLGQGDCQGWLYLKKSNSLTSKWVKRWCVFKHTSMYYYRNKEDEHAEGLVHLHGFTICPVSKEVKSGKFAFRVFNDWVTFVFASESEQDRSKWMNKLGLAAIGFDTSRTMGGIGGFTPGYVPPSPVVTSVTPAAASSATTTTAAQPTSAPNSGTSTPLVSVSPFTNRRQIVAAAAAASASTAAQQENPMTAYYSESDEDAPPDTPQLMRSQRQPAIKLRAAKRHPIKELNEVVTSSLAAHRRSYTLSMMESEERSQNKLVWKVKEVRRLERTIADKQDQLKKIEEFFSSPIDSASLADFIDQYSYIFKDFVEKSEELAVGDDTSDPISESGGFLLDTSQPN